LHHVAAVEGQLGNLACGEDRRHRGILVLIGRDGGFYNLRTLPDRAMTAGAPVGVTVFADLDPAR
jgi:hypothetical protein